MSVAYQLKKFPLRMLHELPYYPPPGATPERKEFINELRMTPVQKPTDFCDRTIEQLVKKHDPGNKRLDRSNRSRLHNKELLIAIIADHVRHGSSVMPEWRRPKSMSRKRAAETPEACRSEAQDLPELYDFNDPARYACET